MSCFFSLSRKCNNGKLVKPETFWIFYFVFTYEPGLFQNAGNNKLYFFVFLTPFLQPECNPHFKTIFCVVTYMTVDDLDYV